MSESILGRRAELLASIRRFFTSRSFTEVSTPKVDKEIIPEAHIDPFEVPGLGYLQASPEMHMKRLLCAGSGPIFEIAKCFRKGERGKLHRPEFTMIEWYRPSDDMQKGMALLEEFMHVVAGWPAAKRTSYAEAFDRAIGVDPFDTATPRSHDWLNLQLAEKVESTLGIDTPEILYHYPANQAALATTTTDARGTPVAERFELYYRGIELANGYHELADPVELRQRLEVANHQRVADNRPALPLPEKLLAAMEDPRLPPCTGVALGIDRLMMLAVGAETIDQVADGI